MSSSSRSKMKWRLAASPDDGLFGELSELHPVAARLLWNRGLRDRAAAEGFLNPDYAAAHDPFLFRQMRAVCERVWQAVERGERIVVYSDYDADGVTGAAVTMVALRTLVQRLGGDPQLISSYIPHREREGYGVKPEPVDRLCQSGMGLLITVDCGIGSADEVSRAVSQGCDAIVIDHHQVPEKIPDCLILHPQVPGETYPFKHLAAAGVAYKFACGLALFAAERGKPFEPGFDKWLLDLVAIATVTDFMPLVGENRILEKWGLVVLNKTRRPGLRQLIRTSGLEPGKIDTHGIGFGLGPRLNAASRMDHAAAALDALMAEDELAAEKLAVRLDQLNRDRQKVGEVIVAAAREQISQAGPRPIQVLAGVGWSPGVVGIIAGKLTSECGVPVFVFSRDGDSFVGSGRSIPEFNVMEALARAGQYASRFGGHPQACGVSVEGEENFAAFKKELERFAEERLSGLDLRPAVDIDAELTASQIDWDLVNCLSVFEPFGEGNRRPRFLLRGCRLVSFDQVGQGGKHARLTLRGDSPRLFKAIAFNQSSVVSGFLPGDPLDLAVEISADEWNGIKRIKVQVIDVRPSGSEEVMINQS